MTINPTTAASMTNSLAKIKKIQMSFGSQLTTVIELLKMMLEKVEHPTMTLPAGNENWHVIKDADKEQFIANVHGAIEQAIREMRNDGNMAVRVNPNAMIEVDVVERRMEEKLDHLIERLHHKAWI